MHVYFSLWYAMEASKPNKLEYISRTYEIDSLLLKILMDWLAAHLGLDSAIWMIYPY
jgi:hypothetical protein